MSEIRSFTANGKSYSYTLVRGRVKNYNLRVKEDGTLRVSAPIGAPILKIEDFLKRNADRIDRARERLKERASARPAPLSLSTGDTVPIWGAPHTVCVVRAQKRRSYPENGTFFLAVHDPDDTSERQKCFAEWLDLEAREKLTARVVALTPFFAPRPQKVPSLTFRTMKSRWGVCRPTEGRVTLNRNLVYLPQPLVDYVICHELAHFHHADHSPRFWQCLGAVMPDHKARRKALNAFPIPNFD